MSVCVLSCMQHVDPDKPAQTMKRGKHILSKSVPHLFVCSNGQFRDQLRFLLQVPTRDGARAQR